MSFARPLVSLLAVAALVAAGCTDRPAPASGASAPTTTAVADGGAVRGLVVDEEYNPLADVSVTGGAAERSTESDEAGRFRLTFSSSGPHDVRFQLEGYLLVVRRVTVPGADELDLGSVVMERLPDAGSKVRIDRLAIKTARIVCAVGAPKPGVTAIPKDDQCSKNNQLAGSEDPSLLTFSVADMGFNAMVIQAKWQKSSAAARAPVLAFYLTGAVLEAERTVDRRLAWADGTNDMGIEGLPGFRWVLAANLVDKPLWRNPAAQLRIRAMAADGNSTLVQNPAGAGTEGSGGVLNQSVDVLVSLVYGTNLVASDYDGFKDG